MYSISIAVITLKMKMNDADPLIHGLMSLWYGLVILSLKMIRKMTQTREKDASFVCPTVKMNSMNF
jgi:hypothetical protein